MILKRNDKPDQKNTDKEYITYETVATEVKVLETRIGSLEDSLEKETSHVEKNYKNEISHIRELDDIHRKYLKEALDKQAVEYERRLAALNHEADQLKEMQSKYTPRETFDGAIAEARKEIDELKEYKTKNEGKGSWIQYIPWILMAISVVLAIYANTKNRDI